MSVTTPSANYQPHINSFHGFLVATNQNLYRIKRQLNVHIPRPRTPCQQMSGVELWMKCINISNTLSRTYNINNDRRL